MQILTHVITQRNRIINETDNKDDELDNDDDDTNSKEPSAEALAKITDYSETEMFVMFLELICCSNCFPVVVIPCISDEQADAATKDPNLKLLFRLSKFHILDDGETDYRVYVWTCPP